MRVLVRITKFFITAIAVFAVAVLLGTLVPRPLFSVNTSDANTVKIYLAGSAIHTDIIIPVDNQSRADFSFLGFDLPLTNPNVKWLMLGWGGRSFYIETPTWSQLKAGPLFRALTLDGAVMHVEVLGEMNEDNPALTKLELSIQEFEALKREMAASFKIDLTGKAQVIAGAAYGEFDQFYEANGKFNALLGCNTWTARILRAAGVRTGFWNPLPQTLRFSLNLYN